MDLLRDHLTQRSAVLFDRRDECCDVRLQLLWRVDQLSDRHLNDTHPLSVLRCARDLLDAGEDIFDHGPKFDRRHQPLWAQDPSELRLVELRKAVLVTDAAVKLDAPLPDSVEDVVLADQDGSSSDGRGGLRAIRLADDGHTSIGRYRVWEPDSVADYSAIFLCLELDVELVLGACGGAADFCGSNVSHCVEEGVLNDVTEIWRWVCCALFLLFLGLGFGFCSLVYIRIRL